MADSRTNASRSRRNEPRSPTKQAAGRTRSKITSQSPPQQRRGSRALRSQSKDVVDGEPNKTTGRGVRRGMRQTSIESTGSEQNADMGTGRRKGKGRAVNTATGDLSTVPEDPLTTVHTPPEAEGDRTIINEYNEEAEPLEAAESPAAHSTASGISGTTVRTSHSVQEIADMNTDLILVALPSLSKSSRDLLRALMPEKPTQESIAEAAKDLLLPASKLSKRLNYFERSFCNDRDQFGTDQYIIRNTVNKALLGVRTSKDIGSGPWSPDLILQQANLAIFATKLLVFQRGSQELWAAVALLDSSFPAPFLSTLEPDSDSVIGSSKLLRETFDLGLDLRTQLMLLLLLDNYDKSNYDPERILAHVFFESSGPQGDERLREWAVPGLGGNDTKMPTEFEGLVVERIKQIRRLFSDDPDPDSLFVTGEPGDVPTELKRLAESFPWTKFLFSLAQWTNTRLGEIEAQMAEQGGPDIIVGALRNEIERRQIERGNAGGGEDGEGHSDEEDQADGPMIDLTFNPPAASLKGASNQDAGTGRLLPAAEIDERGRGVSFNKLRAIRSLKTRETRLSFKEAGNPDPADKADEVEDEGDNWRPQQQDDNDLDDQYAATRSSARLRQAGQPASSMQPPASSLPPSSAPMILARFEAIQREKNKENQIESEIMDKGKQRDGHPAARRRFIDPQPTREVVQFGDGFDESPPTSFQKPVPEASSRKRQRPTEESDEDDNEEDDDEAEEFETDTRQVKENRRKMLRIEQQAEQGRSTETIEDSQQSQESTPRAQRSEVPPQGQRHRSSRQQNRPTARNPPPEDASQRSPRSSRAGPVSSQPGTQIPYSQINESAKEAVMNNVQRHKPQVRRAWSQEETTRFIELIEQHGTSWSKIERLGEALLQHRTQVNLKDKARNIKMDYLKSQTELPPNFEHVRLNRLQLKQLEDMGIPYHQGEGD